MRRGRMLSRPARTPSAAPTTRSSTSAPTAAFQPGPPRVSGAAAGAGQTSFRAPPNVLQRIDPETGRVTARLAIGDQQPVALVRAGDDLDVVTAQGRVLVVRG